MDLRQHFGRNLRDVRQARELTQEQLGFLAGLDRTEISLLERGGREPRLSTMLKLAEALEVDAEKLYRGIRLLPPADRFEVDLGEGEGIERGPGRRDGQPG